MSIRKTITVSGEEISFETSSDLEISSKICPISLNKGQRLLRKTLANHVQPQYYPIINEDGFHFCPNLNCPMYYFNNLTDQYFGKQDIHSIVMHKMPIRTENRPVCYCKNVLEQTILDELLLKQCCDSIIDIQNFTEANTGKDCAITNPTGRCCGKQVREILEWTKAQGLDIAVPLIEEAMSCCVRIDKATDDTYEIMLKE